MNILSGGHPRTPGSGGHPRTPDDSEEIRCPSCSHLLVLRSGPQVAPHFAHRPRQSCRNRPGHRTVTLRLEQLTLFDMEPVTPPGPAQRPARSPAPAAYDGLGAWPLDSTGPFSESPAPRPAAVRPARRRRRAWLPRLVRWVKARGKSH
jgi:hypothetical protein